MKKLAFFLIILLVCNLSFASVDLDGVDDEIDFGNPSKVSAIADHLTVGCWIKFTDTDRGDIIGKWPVSAGQFKFVLLHGLTAGKLQFFVSASGSSAFGSAVGATTMSINTWYYVIGTFDKPTVTSYVNGVQQGTGTLATNLKVNSTENLKVSTGLLFDGSVKDCGIWNVILTTDQMKLIVNSKVKRFYLQIQPNNLVFYPPLDDCADGTSCDGKTFLDMSSSPSNGTGDSGADSSLVGVAETQQSYP